MILSFKNLPTPATLNKYGLTPADWLSIVENQNYSCPICGVEFDGERRMNIDHYHVKGFKKMSPEKKRKYVRGVLCWTCNRLIVGRGVTIPRLRNATTYLEEFEKRKPQ